jgi:hypothetical protein
LDLRSFSRTQSIWVANSLSLRSGARTTAEPVRCERDLEIETKSARETFECLERGVTWLRFQPTNDFSRQSRKFHGFSLCP